jgi:hypothetical protein
MSVGSGPLLELWLGAKLVDLDPGSEHSLDVSWADLGHELGETSVLKAPMWGVR